MTEHNKILKAIISYTTEHGYPPTLREIGNEVGLHSSSAVHQHITWMLADGILETDAEGSPRAIRVPGYEFQQVTGKLKSPGNTGRNRTGKENLLVGQLKKERIIIYEY